ncbi:uncharacterized protein LOC109831277 [Asparagus officinalis]|uniref:uncharacterized protein LOC109831277 n=1 Tax=Asparagus officinalis TaxID=4686 RepID=UPI00098E43FF|nr:uncharacterized protein LOC109831277 [Asparagus officinalis]
MEAALKTIWDIHTNKELLWIKWVHGTYLKNLNIWQVEVKTRDSWMWKQLLKARKKAVALCGSLENLQSLIRSCCRNSKIKLSALYLALSPTENRVPWSTTIWGGFNYPKHSFISWLAVQDRLLTQDKLIRRGIIQTNQCILCSGAEVECRNHIFFDCKFSQDVWNKIMDWLCFKWRCCDWNQLLNWYSFSLLGKSFKHSVKRMAFTSSIYNIWMERNVRIFNQKCKTVEQLVKLIKVDLMTTIINSKIDAESKNWVLSL